MKTPESNVVHLRVPSRHGPTSITRDLVESLKPEVKAFERRDTKLKGFLIRVQPSGQKTYYVEYARHKRVKLGSDPELKTAVARDQATRVIGNVANGRDIWDGIKSTGASGPTLGDFIAGSNPKEEDVTKWDGAYAKWYSVRSKSPRSFRENLQALREWYRLWWEVPLTKITAGMIEDMKAVRRQTHGNSDGTIRRGLSRLAAVFSYAHKHGIENNAFEKVQLPKDRAGKIRFLDDEERARLKQALGLDSTPGYLRTMVIVSLHTGLRQGELFQLTWDNVDLKLGHLTVLDTTSKTPKTRHVPLHPVVRAALLAWQPKNAKGLVFKSKDGGKFDNVDKTWAALLKNAEIENFRWHDMRHDFVSQLVQNGVPLYTAGALAGHSRSTTTERYAHLAPSQKTDAIATLNW